MASSDIVLIAPWSVGAAHVERSENLHIRRTMYARWTHDKVADEAILPSLRAHPAKLFQLPGLLWALYRGLDRAVRDHKPDVLHAHWIVPGGLLAVLIGGRRQIPVVVTAHGADAHAMNGRVGTILKRFVLRRAARTFPVSNEIATLLRKVEVEAVGPVLTMGVSGDQLQTEAGPRNPVAGRVVFVGRLSDKKGVDVLLAAAGLAQQVRELRIIGDGPDRDALQQQTIELGVEDRVSFLGKLTAAEVATELNAASAVALPSKSGAGGDRDGTPVVLMEAMTLGVPVVVSDLGGLGEHVTDQQTGLVVAQDDPDALSTALDALLSSPTLQAHLGERAQHYAKEFFEVSAIGARFEEHIRRELGS